MATSPHKNDDLGSRIAEAQARQAARVKPKPQGSAAGYGVGMRIVLDLIGGAIVGLVFGLALDEVAGTSPWGLLILLTLGLVAGFRLMLRSAQQQANRTAQETDTAETQAGSVEEGKED